MPHRTQSKKVRRFIGYALNDDVLRWIHPHNRAYVMLGTHHAILQDGAKNAPRFRIWRAKKNGRMRITVTVVSERLK